MWYKILGVKKNASVSEIEEAYRRKSLDPKIMQDLEKSVELRNAYTEGINQINNQKVFSESFNTYDHLNNEDIKDVEIKTDVKRKIKVDFKQEDSHSTNVEKKPRKVINEKDRRNNRKSKKLAIILSILSIVYLTYVNFSEIFNFSLKEFDLKLCVEEGVSEGKVTAEDLSYIDGEIVESGYNSIDITMSEETLTLENGSTINRKALLSINAYDDSAFCNVDVVDIIDENIIRRVNLSFDNFYFVSYYYADEYAEGKSDENISTSYIDGISISEFDKFKKENMSSSFFEYIDVEEEVKQVELVTETYKSLIE